MKIPARDLPLVARVLIRTYGWRGIGRRAAYELSHRSGHLARVLPAEDRLTPAEPDWCWPLRFDLEEIRRGYARLEELDAIRDEVVTDAERVLAGEMRFYGWTWKRTEWPPRWHVNPWTGYEYPQEHWTRISDFQPEHGDIKDVWEMSRLPFTYIFARAWLLTGHDHYPEAWWRAIEDWAEHNPPNRGVNWKCGQETSLRGVALQFGLMTFADHASTTPDRLRLAGGLLRASVRRVLPTLRYALSQRNNHAISEAVFLETTAVARVVDPAAGRAGRRALREAVADQFYDDGWYAQHSFNYQRLAVHTLIWLNRVRAEAGLASEHSADAAVDRSRTLLRSAQDPHSGWLPNLGPDDGALLFPLTTCEHRNYRPLLATLGSDDTGEEPRHREHEEAVWLATGEFSQSPEKTPAGSIRVMRGARTHVVVRTGTGSHRPNHDDLLHLDLWVEGRNVLADSGTYRYTAPTPWANALAIRRVHNVPYSESRPKPRLGRFLTLSWPTSEVVRWETMEDDTQILEVHRRDEVAEQSRTVLRRGDRYRIVDHADGGAFAVRWTFGESCRARITDWGAEITSGTTEIAVYGDVEELATEESDPASGWISTGYSERSPTSAIVAHSKGLAVVTVIRPFAARPSIGR